ncbi:MAG TPA: DUF2846 domain-containing protein [Thermohalobaculum sp.]|nr:DUF2846 domain-containing protein [Thermohalobaculum sp.]
MSKLRAVVFLVGTLLVSACASGPKFAEIKGNISAMPDGQARIYFYRTQIVGAAVQPSIILNQENVGSCEPKGVFYKDVEPGKYEASVETEVERRLTLVLGPGEEKYVRCHISMGLIVGHGNLELVDPAEAKADIQDLSYTGS